MARVIVCDNCMEQGQLSFANVIQVNVSVTAPDGSVRDIRKVVSACTAHSGPVKALADWLGERKPDTSPALPAAGAAPDPPAWGESEPVYEFKCGKCSEVVDTSKRSYHAQARHMVRVAEVPWVPLFDVEEANFGVCQCGFITQKGRQLTSHLKNYGHTEDVGKHPLRSEDFRTETAKAVFRAAGE